MLAIPEEALKFVRLLTVSVIVAFSSPPNAAENCAQVALQSLPENHPACLFYTGTEGFRKHDYTYAKARWDALLKLPEIPLELEYLRTNAYNNLGFLYYMGWGTSVDHRHAIENWSYATKLGHEEAAYHLCHTYGDAKEPEYDPKVALGYCRESLRRYSLLNEKNEATSEVVAQLKGYIIRLESQ
jgi:TPR repeat protein